LRCNTATYDAFERPLNVDTCHIRNYVGICGSKTFTSSHNWLTFTQGSPVAANKVRVTVNSNAPAIAGVYPVTVTVSLTDYPAI